MTVAEAGSSSVAGEGVEERRALRGLVERVLRGNGYARRSGERRSLPAWVFPSLLTGFAALRVLCVGVLIAAWLDWLVDPRFWATGAPVTAAHTTPFHKHPNLFGWRFGFQGLVHMHVITGVGLLLVCLVPLVTKKGGRAHARFGKAFVALWAVHLLDGLINSAQILLARGFDPTRYLSSTKQGFSLYLYVQFAFISALVVDFLAHGLAALHYKNRVPSRRVRAVMLALPLTSASMGSAMAVWAVLHLTGIRRSDASPTATEFAFVYLAQVPAYLFLAGKNVAYWLRPEPRVWLQGWVTEHQRNMMFCVGVTLYTACANLTMRVAPSLTAPLFASIDVGFVVWMLAKERGIRREIVGGRLGIALVSHLFRLRRGEEAAPIAPRDAAWILRMFDDSRNGTLEAAEIRGLLAAQGIRPGDAELAALFQTLDGDGDGHVDAAELAGFLSRGFAGDTRRAEELAFCFRRLDADGDGRVSGTELRAAVEAEPRSTAIEGIARDADQGTGLDLDAFTRLASPRRERAFEAR